MTLIDRAKQIKNETTQGANTAERVGGLMADIVAELDTKASSQQVANLFDAKSTEIDKQLTAKEKEIDEKMQNMPKNIVTFYGEDEESRTTIVNTKPFEKNGYYVDSTGSLVISSSSNVLYNCPIEIGNYRLNWGKSIIGTNTPIIFFYDSSGVMYSSLQATKQITEFSITKAGFVSFSLSGSNSKGTYNISDTYELISNTSVVTNHTCVGIDAGGERILLDDILQKHNILSVLATSETKNFEAIGTGYWSGNVGEKSIISTEYNYMYMDLMNISEGSILRFTNFYFTNGTQLIAQLLDANSIIVKRLSFADCIKIDESYNYTVPQGVTKIGLFFDNSGESNGFTYDKATYCLNKNGTNLEETRKIKNELIDIKYILEVLGGNALNYMYLRGNATKDYAKKKVAFITGGQSNTYGPTSIVGKMPTSFVDEKGITVPYLENGEMPNTLYSMNNISGIGSPFKGTRWAYDVIALRRLSYHLAEEVLNIKWAVGGTGIDPSVTNNNGCWTPEIKNIPIGSPHLCALFEQSVRFGMKIYSEQFEIKAFLWHQGETDSLTTTARKNYYNNFKDVISYVRGFVGNPVLPVIFGTISHRSEQYSKEVEDAQKRIANEYSNVYLIDMSEGTLSDPYHFDTESMEYFGTEVYKILRDKIL